MLFLLLQEIFEEEDGPVILEEEKVVKEVKSEETQQVSYFYVGCSL